MSSTVTRYQAPVHTYGHPERESQQPYYNYGLNSYSSNSRSLADDAYPEDLYYPGCSYVPYGPEYSQFEETEEAFGYEHSMQDNYTSPRVQLLCPRPTLPPSQLPPHFSSYDWHSEAPASVSQAERSRYPSQLPQAGEIQQSVGNHQYMSRCYPAQPEFAVSDPNSMASSYLGEGYIPSFDQSSTQSSQFNGQSGYYHTAHQPVPPEQHSSYSELAPNLDFMNRLSKSARKPNEGAMAKDTISSPTIEKNPFALGFDGPPLTAFGRKVPVHAPRPVSIKVPSKKEVREAGFVSR